jgi:hypothetical protein
MDHHGSTDGEEALRLQLSVHLDRKPISGKLRDDGGTEERFVGWLGFVGALEKLYRLHQSAQRAAGSTGT